MFITDFAPSLFRKPYRYTPALNFTLLLLRRTFLQSFNACFSHEFTNMHLRSQSAQMLRYVMTRVYPQEMYSRLYTHCKKFDVDVKIPTKRVGFNNPTLIPNQKLLLIANIHIHFAANTRNSSTGSVLPHIVLTGVCTRRIVLCHPDIIVIQ